MRVHRHEDPDTTDRYLVKSAHAEEPEAWEDWWVRRRMNPLVLLEAVAIAVLPMQVKRVIYRYRYGWHIDTTARIGLSLIVGVREADIGPDVKIGSFNVFRDLQRLHLASGAAVGQWNWFTAARDLIPDHPDKEGTLVIEREAAVVSRHYLDCSGGVHIGAFSVLSGIRSSVFSHQISVETNRQVCMSVHIGHHCMLGTNLCILPGAQIASAAQVAAGSVVTGSLSDSGMLYAGVPAKPIRKRDGAFFVREIGEVKP